MNRFFAGIDVGSTTIKAVVSDAADDKILWKDYRRHETRQPETLLDFLRRMEAETGIAPDNCRVFMTGSGGQMFTDLIGAKFVQEVLAASLAVERRHQEASAIVEIGGQDAKIVVLRRENGVVKKLPSMNDKCAGGTGAVIDKISKKLGIPLDDISGLHYDGIRLHQVAGKCGVFAETDINGLQKQGVPARELMASLFEAFVLQNLQVLARGHTLMPHVILLGGPNAFIPGMREAWRHNTALMWRERGVEIPQNAQTKDLIYAPPDAEYYGAIGAIEYGREEGHDVGVYLGLEKLRELCEGHSSGRGSGEKGIPALVGSEREVEEFLKAYAPPKFTPPVFRPGDVARGFIGIDGGSTSTKAVLLSREGEVLARAYQLSKGNPIQDTIEILEKLRGQVESQGASIEVLGAATTGYAKDTLRDVIRADVALVETVAHTKSALHYYGVPDAIVDVGGQDIKLMILKDGRVKDFKLNTQCSAGNGYFLQAIAEGFGYRVEQFAETAFTARQMPVFPYGCAVFLQSDIDSFQGQGWKPNEILAGLAAVLPKNVWLYIAKIPNLAELGTRFILQGGTQNNLAAVKAQVDFICERFKGTGKTPEITVHKHAGEAGAIGAAFEAMTLIDAGRETTFIGLDAVRKIEFKTTVGEETRCRFCKNNCLRTFIDIGVDGAYRRLIIAACEKGSVEDAGAMKDIQATLSAAMKANPNLLDYADREVWKTSAPEESPDGKARAALPKNLAEKREKFRVGIPRVLGLFAYAPLFSRYFESLGIQPANIVYSDHTGEEMFRAGSKRGSIDPCYPSKLALAHVHNLLFEKHKRRALDCIFFPMMDVLRSPLIIRAQNACPTTALTPEVVRAAFVKETDLFKDNGVLYLNPLLDLAKPQLLARQLYAEFETVLGLSKKENLRAVEAGYENLDKYENSLQRKARETLDRLEKEKRLGIVLLGRPYHHDPGIHLGIPDELQKRGYPVFSQSTLPLDAEMLERLFGDEVREGIIETPMDIDDVWKHTFSANSAYKIWAAKFTARHPNLIAVELSNFKCGHDAPIYSTIERIIETSGTPYFAFKDIDENRPAGSIRLRVETIDYFLQLYRRRLWESPHGA
ncbi:MAG: acyl-CoA dehydratase activase-related protein [Acidobacteriota bacterium]|jgi:predicted CoA-substrate-specific enzyme activase|nr:acyl-CoA dehydratase activase-related protein [Acidobacteriota bacterium]